MIHDWGEVVTGNRRELRLDHLLTLKKRSLKCSHRLSDENEQ